ncbi:TolC family protein [Citrifermentans bremense]|uniref:TolC family protein n=1 Tax=Citrifermentans bremense TaxID=60035 RepID=UPI000406D2D3|nr:TolC family protein [Citrifermentans bremense]
MRRALIILALMALTGTGAANAETLTLQECLTKAAASSRGLRASTHDVAIAQEQISIARSARLPRVDLQAGYTAQLDPQAVKFGNIVQETQDARYPFLNLTIYNTLYDFGRTGAREARARLRRDAAQFSHLGQEQDLFLEVVRAYFGILAAEKLVGAANDEVVQMTAHQKTAQALFEEGVVTRNDLLQAEVRVASSRQNLYGALNLIENGWLYLNYLTGAPASHRADLQEQIETPPLPDQQSVPDLSKRAEISALRAVVNADEHAVKEAKSDYYPEIFARFGLDYLDNSKVREQTIYAATLGLKVNLFDGAAKEARIRQAVESRSRDEERMRDLEERVRLELSTAQNDMKVALTRLKVAEKAIEQGRENLRITRDRYQEKVGTATEVIDAQTLLTQTRTDYFRSVFDLQVAAARVKRATGEL